MDDIDYSATERLDPAEYAAFLGRSDLGRLYPPKDFDARLRRLLERTGITITARHRGELVGACLGVTDHAYFLFITDLGVVRGHERQGVGRQLMRLAHATAGGPQEITVVTWSNPESLPFYAACGLLPERGLVGREASP